MPVYKLPSGARLNNTTANLQVRSLTRAITGRMCSHELEHPVGNKCFSCLTLVMARHLIIEWRPVAFIINN